MIEATTVATPATFARGYLAHRAYLVRAGYVLPADPSRWQREQDVLAWLARQGTMSEPRFLEILSDRADNAVEACIRQLCSALLTEWRNVPMRELWASKASDDQPPG